MKGWRLIALGVVFGFLGAGIIWLSSTPPRGDPIQLLPPPTPAPIQVHVSGAVVKPGVYSLPVNSRVKDAIEAAGGCTEEALTENLNLASPLEDGQKIWVPHPATGTPPEAGGESEEGESRAGLIPLAPSSGKININTATLEELETLPGIGPVTAQKIIDFREAEGPFLYIEEIQKVSGIGPATYEKIKDQITVGEAP